MHGLAICRQILDIVLAHCQGKPVRAITLELPDTMHHTQDEIKDMLAMLCEGTPAEGARVSIVREASSAVRVCDIDIEA